MDTPLRIEEKAQSGRNDKCDGGGRSDMKGKRKKEKKKEGKKKERKERKKRKDLCRSI